MQKTRYAVAFGIPLVALLSVTFAAAWTGPTAAPPGNNVAAPINVGNVDQVKNGGLGLNSLAVFGNSLLGGSTGSNAYLNFGPTSGTNGYGIRDTAGTLEFKNLNGSWASLQSTIFTLCGSGACGGGDGSSSYIRRTNAAWTTPATVSCQGVEKVIGGGCSCGGGNASVHTSYPASDTQWMCECIDSSGSPSPVATAWAICANIR